MYKILNKLFGWDYIYWADAYASGISKVIVLPDKSVRFKYYGYIVSVTYPGVIVKFLTCKPDKYMKKYETKDPT